MLIRATVSLSAESEEVHLMTPIWLGSRLCLALALFAAGASLQADEQAHERAGFKLPAEFRARAAEYMQARVRVTGFSGTVLVARTGRPIFRNGYGRANN